MLWSRRWNVANELPYGRLPSRPATLVWQHGLIRQGTTRGSLDGMLGPRSCDIGVAFNVLNDLRLPYHAVPCHSPGDGQTVRFKFDPLRKHMLLRGLDAVGLTLESAGDIRKFEQA